MRTKNYKGILRCHQAADTAVIMVNLQILLVAGLAALAQARVGHQGCYDPNIVGEIKGVKLVC